MPEFLINALIVGLAIALIAGPLGSFTVWRKMAYFGDTLAHSALIGVAFGLFLEINITLSIILACFLIAVVLVFLEQQNSLSTDTLLGVLSHSSLALGLVCVSLYSDSQISLYSYLFGDFLTVSRNEAVLICVAVFVLMTLVVYLWKPLLMISTDEDLARVEGKNIRRLRLILMLMIACVIALAMKIVGVMLITALLIIPAATSRRLTSSPEAMAAIASLLGGCAVISGLSASYWIDIPTGPAVVLCSFVFFIVSLAVRSKA
ncbi:MAG: zinc transport system permease protein [Lentisphaeria bacterium]|jgi:zinc transport system permease protein